MRNPWMNMLVNGLKPIESRCSQKRIIPYRAVEVKDWIYFRLSGAKAVEYRTIVEKREYWTGKYVVEKLTEYQTEIGIDANYIEKRAKCLYLSLIWLGKVERIVPFEFVKNDQRAWITNFKVPKIITIL